MASIIKRGDSWRAEVYVRGKRASKTFRTRQEARQWAARQEALLDQPPGRETFRAVLERYRRDVSPTKRGAIWEDRRIGALLRDPIADKRIGEITPNDLAEWRDRRLRQVSPATVKREANLIGSIFTTARREWGLIDKNPMSDVRKPADAPPRDRLPTDDEMERLAYVASLGPVAGRTFAAFRFAIETGMRAGEIAGLRRSDIRGSVARLPMTKNGTARDVPLSSEARRILDGLGDDLFDTTPERLSSNFRNLCKRAGVEGLTFHDARHCAVTRLSRKLDVLALARMIGHRNISQLRTYYNETAEDIAKRLE